MPTTSPYRHPVGKLIATVAVIQVISGALLSWGCLCTMDSRLVGMLLAFGMGAFVVVFALAAYWTRTRPKAATITAIVTELVLLALLVLINTGGSSSVWYVQVPVLLLLGTAVSIAFRHARLLNG